MKIQITAKEKGQRIDKFVRRFIREAPLSFIYKIFRKKDVKVNGHKAAIDYILQDGDVIDIYLQPQLLEKFQKEYEIRPVKVNLDIIYEDENILIANKPAGLLTHADEKNRSVTLANFFVSYLMQKGEYDPKKAYGFVPGPAHRLDRNTSGLVVMGKTLPAMQALLQLFRERTQIEKQYLALVKGVTPPQGRINIPLKKDSAKSLVTKATLKEGGKTAITEYVRAQTFTTFTLVKVKLLTGRMHQIRAHFALIKHPIVGDGKYGDFNTNKEFKRRYDLQHQFLHAGTFAFLQPSGLLSYLATKTFTASLPAQLQSILDCLA